MVSRHRLTATLPPSTDTCRGPTNPFWALLLRCYSAIEPYYFHHGAVLNPPGTYPTCQDDSHFCKAVARTNEANPSIVGLRLKSMAAESLLPINDTRTEKDLI
jgi:hypothetical protein